MRSSKGLGTIALFLIVGLILTVSAWVFFIFFKIHVTSIAVDVDSINRYQEIPTTFLGITTFVEGEEKMTAFGENPDNRDKKKINCFDGDGPAGSHPPNADLCRKHLAFYMAKTANSVGRPLFSSQVERYAGSGLPSGLDLIILAGQLISPPPNFPTLSAIKNNIRASLPESCYKISIESSGKEIDKLDSYSDLPEGLGGGKRSEVEIKFRRDCNIDSPKINEPYPLPIFLNGEPTLSVQRLLIYSSITSGEGLLVTWPRYNTKFDFGGG